MNESERVEARRAEVERLHKAHKTERQIATALGVSRTTVWTDLQVIRGRAVKAERRA